MFRTPRAPPHRPSAGELWQDSRLRNLHVANEFKVRRLLEGGQDARPRRKDGPAWQPVRLRPAPPPCASALRLRLAPLHAAARAARAAAPAARDMPSSRTAPRPCVRFEGEWREGKPIIKDKANQSPDFLAWLNDSVGAVAGPRRNKARCPSRLPRQPCAPTPPLLPPPRAPDPPPGTPDG